MLTSARVILPLAIWITFSLMQLMAQTFKTLHHFHTNDGRYPAHELVLSNNTLYGTAGVGGSFDRGTIFSLKTDGTDPANSISRPISIPFERSG